jgi:pilus assembly protein Flp/PilA
VLATKPVKEFVANEDGAALIEYTVLLGMLLVVALATIGAVGGWTTSEWTQLNSLVQK